MYKLILTCSLLTITTLSGSPRMYQEKQHRVASHDLTLIEDISPENTVIAFDLHEVLFKRHPMRIARHLFRSLRRGLIVHGFNPWFWYKARKVWNSKNGCMIWEDFYKQLSIEYPRIKAYEDDFMAASIECEPIKPMIRLVQQLKEDGYYLVVLSNIGSDTYEKHREKFPTVMSLFDDIFTPSPDNGYSCKPEREFYEDFKDFLSQKGHGDKQILFIDDLAQNIHGAEKAGIIGLKCDSAEQVIRFFKEHKIVEPENKLRQPEKDAEEDVVIASDNVVPNKSREESPDTLSTSGDPTFKHQEPMQKPGQEENMC